MFYAAHSGIRYLVLLAGLIVVFYALVGLLGKKDYTPLMAKLASAFTGLIHLNVLLGVAVLLSRPFQTMLIGHLFLMIGAAVVAQFTTSVVRRRPEEEKTFGPHLVGAALALAFIAAGIMSIGRGVFMSTVG